jgi:hypothetical protein
MRSINLWTTAMFRLRTGNLQVFAFAAVAGLFSISPVRAAFVDLTPSAGAGNSAAAVSLADLVGGAVTGITVGDKSFTGFSYSMTGDMPAATNVNVLGFQDSLGNWGVTFQGAFMDLPGGSASDAVIRFMVQAMFGSIPEQITGAHLQLNGIGVGANSIFIVDESFAPNSSDTLSAYKSTIASGGAQFNDATVFDAPPTILHVTKDILALAGANTFLPARAPVIDQSFSSLIPETVPEPTSLLLGCAALAAVWRSAKRFQITLR